MNAFLDAALRGQLPEAGLLPVLILLVVFGILAFGSRMISRPERGDVAPVPDLPEVRLQILS